MAAILRVKRRNGDEPLIALLIASKRRKTDDNSADAKETDAESTTVLKFAGTVKNQEADAVKNLVSTLSKDKLVANYKKHNVDVLAKARERRRQTTIENRYKVINCLRSLDNSTHEDIEDKVTTLIDVEDSVSCSIPKNADAEENEDYVYDVYYASTGGSVYIDESVSVHPFHQEFIYDSYRNGQAVSENESESEDSNSESNWRNDYPDSDHSANSIDEDDMRVAVWTLKVYDGNDDDDDNDNDNDNDNDDDDDDDDDDNDDDVGIADDVDCCDDDYSSHPFAYQYDEADVELYGYKYAAYKMRLIQRESDYSSGDVSFDPFGKSGNEQLDDSCSSHDDLKTQTDTVVPGAKKCPKGAALTSAERDDNTEYSNDADDEDDEISAE